MSSNAERREVFQRAIEEAHRAVCAFSIGDIDGRWRGRALDALAIAQDNVVRGLRERDDENEKQRRSA
jgi:hypothetical protein